MTHDEKTFQALRECYQAGDILALLQASRLAKATLVPVPEWVMEPMEELIREILTSKKLGSRGRGNKPFGRFTKAYIRTVRASSYFYVRAWQNNPSFFRRMPRHVIQEWYSEVVEWPAGGGYLDALRLVNNALKGTEFQAHSTTLRKAATGMKPPVWVGRQEVEEELGLRGGPKGIFGPPRQPIPQHVLQLLDA